MPPSSGSSGSRSAGAAGNEDSLTFRRRTKGGFRTKAAAKAWATAYMVDRARGTYLPPNTARTFREAAGEWLASRTKIKARTRESYEGLLTGDGSRLAARFADAVVANIRSEDVEAFVLTLQAEGARSSTVRNNVAVLRAVLQREVKARRIPYNPVLGVELPAVPRPQNYDKVRYDLTASHLDGIVASLPWPYDVLTLTAAYTGLRAGELAGPCKQGRLSAFVCLPRLTPSDIIAPIRDEMSDVRPCIRPIIKRRSEGADSRR